MTTLERVLLAAPRGWCAGVDRAVDIVERALDLYGPPVYVRKQIVHNRHVVEGLERRGAIFVHEEVEGTMGQAPERTILVQDADEAERVEVPDPDNVSFITQTTLSVDDTKDIVAALRRRFPNISGPTKSDICYATTNRQAAVKV